MMQACMRCSTLAPTTPHKWGLLWLCERCLLTPVCREYDHRFRGSRDPGVWICVLCGTTLESQGITRTPVKADTPVTDVDC
jgi:hypothetical protein